MPTLVARAAGALAALAFFTQVAPLSAAIKPHGLFTENAVLQQGQKIPVFGTTDKTEDVTVSVAGQTVTATPKDGAWRVELQPLKAGGPHVLSIAQGGDKLELKNVLVGDVWVCGGQSNMEWPIERSAGAQEASDPATMSDQVRLFTVPRRGNGAAESDVTGNWSTCSPESIKHFSAVGYYFGRDLQKAVKTPIGLINSNVGGTTAERWMSKETLDATPALKEMKPTQGVHDLWNAMLAPLTKYPIRGAIWYQGESNAERAWQYRTLLPAMIKSWRDAWNEGDFPFLVVQLAPFMKINREPAESQWAELRDAQLFTSQSVPNVGLAVLTELGDEGDIHPQRKREVGERLALAARAIAYEEKITYSGPLYDKMTVSGDKVILNFKHVGQGLVAKDGDLYGFTVAGEDKKFYNATAKIEGETVVLSSDKVPNPKAVRYNWTDFPQGNLWNKEGLPASPFRTDDFLLTTQSRN